MGYALDPTSFFHLFPFLPSLLSLCGDLSSESITQKAKRKKKKKKKRWGCRSGSVLVFILSLGFWMEWVSLFNFFSFRSA